MRYVFIVLVAFLTFFSAYGQKFKYTTYMGEEMPFSQVNQVIQDEKSYMWLATDQGLFRFDGSRFEDYNTNLESRYIHALIQLEDQSLLFSNERKLHTVGKDKVIVHQFHFIG